MRGCGPGGGVCWTGLKRPDFYSRVVDRGERPELDPSWPLPVRELLKSCWRTNLDERLSFREVAGILKVRHNTLRLCVFCVLWKRRWEKWGRFFAVYAFTPPGGAVVGMVLLLLL